MQVVDEAGAANSVVSAQAASAVTATGAPELEEWQKAKAPVDLAAPSQGGGGSLPPLTGKPTTAPEFDGRTLFIIRSGLDALGDFEEGVLTSLTESIPVLPSQGYLVEVFGPLSLEVATRLQFREKGQALNAFEGVLVSELHLLHGESRILFLVESDQGNKVYPVRAVQTAASFVIQEVLQPESEC